MGLFIRKSIEALQAEAKETGSGTLKRVLGPVSLVSSRGRCNYRSRIIFHYRNRSCIVYRTSYHTFLYYCSHRLLFCRTLLCRICFHDSGIRECLYLLLRHHGRTYRLDYRMGLSIGIYRSSHYCQYQLEPLHDCIPARSRHRFTPCIYSMSMGRGHCQYSCHDNCGPHELDSDARHRRKFFL